ncbi:uncharacterized protein LOC144199441 isoform X2 [Stigmatopora nigra]
MVSSLTHGFLLFCCLTAWAAGPGQLVGYPPETCAAPNSSVTLRCSFTPLTPVARVVWCVRHLICQGTTPSVYDSNGMRRDPHYVYLGDLERDCTLRIHQVRRRDQQTFRFRMETVDARHNFTGIAGVKVSVVDDDPMRVVSEQPGRAGEGAGLTLLCTWRCSFLGLDVLWRRDGGRLSESGPALHLGPPTVARAGNYTCALSGHPRTTSPPFSVQAEPRRDERSPNYALYVGVPAALAVAGAVVVSLLVRRRRRRTLDAGNEGEGSRNVYEEPPPRASRSGPDGQEVEQTAGEVNYAAVRFKAKAVGRPASESKEDVVYSSVTKTRARDDGE